MPGSEGRRWEGSELHPLLRHGDAAYADWRIQELARATDRLRALRTRARAGEGRLRLRVEKCQASRLYGSARQVEGTTCPTHHTARWFHCGDIRSSRCLERSSALSR